MRTSPSPTRSPSHGVKRVIGALLTVVVTIIGMTLLSGGTASAQTDPTTVGGVTVDGCTLVSDAPAGVSFTAACNDHDICYGTHALSRSKCDAVLYKELIQACNAHRSTNYYACLSWAGIYYLGVRIFGQPYYDAANPAARVLTPMSA